jgi:hypothetical protein
MASDPGIQPSTIGNENKQKQPVVMETRCDATDKV